MLTQFELIKEIEKLSNDKRVFRWLAAAIGDWAIIVLTFYVAHQANNFLIYFLAVFVLGVMIHALGVLGHEGVHYLISKNRRLNDFLANLFCYWPIALTLEGYRAFHTQHHIWTNSEKDPELVHKRNVPDWELPMKRTKILRYFIGDLFLIRVKHLMQVFTITQPPCVKFTPSTIIFWIIAEILLIALGAPYILILWFIAHLTSGWAILRLRIYHEHLGAKRVNRVHIPWWYRCIMAQHNIWIHQEHHDWPTVPYYHLPKVRELTKDSPPIIPIFALYKSFETHHPLASGTPGLQSSEIKTTSIF